MKLAYAFVTCSLLLLSLASQVTSATNTRNITKNADHEEDDTYHEHSLSHFENNKFQLPAVTVQQLCPRGLRMWILGKIFFTFCSV
jgi:hypothetical protein